MKIFPSLCLLALALPACEKKASPEIAPSAPSSAAAASTMLAAPPAAPVEARTATPVAPSLDGIDACWIKAAAVSAALGGPYSEGKALPPIGSIPRRSCNYEGKNGSLRVNVTALEPSRVEAIRKDPTMAYAGVTSAIEKDPDGARFQMQKDLGTCALHFVKGSRQYEIRLMSCREPDAAAQAKLVKLPRP